MTVEDNKALVRRQFDEIWNKANWATVEELYAPSYVNHDPYNPEQGTGPEGFRQRVEGYRGVIHGFDLRIEHQMAAADAFVVGKGTDFGDQLAALDIALDHPIERTAVGNLGATRRHHAGCVPVFGRLTGTAPLVEAEGNPLFEILDAVAADAEF